MKILVISDNHGSVGNFQKVLELEKPVDYIIHCGDLEGTEWDIKEAAGCPVEMVAGNNDFFSDLPKEREFTLQGLRMMITHGHNYYVYMNRETLRREAMGRGIDVVFFGHTHMPVVDETGPVTMVNPGSLSYPRQANRQPSYCIMTCDGQRGASFELKYL